MSPSSALFASGSRLGNQLAFLAEIDRLKDVLRRSLVAGSGRRENSAEHSWHLAMMLLVLGEDPSPLGPVDRERVLKMVLVHDLVEIDADDTFCYDAAGNATKAARELAAAERIFQLLPADQAAQMRAWWDEFEAGVTPEAKLAQALDRLQPILQNLRTEGRSWREHGVTKAQVLDRNRKIGEAWPEIWQELLPQIEEAERRGWLRG
jgi:putative hydrolase of HD superfamily